MKKLIFTLAAIAICGLVSAQFRAPQVEPLPEGFKPASTNTFISTYPGVNAETRQAIFRVVAPDADSVQLNLGGNHNMKRAMRDKLTHRRMVVMASSPEGIPMEHLAIKKQIINR